MDAEIQNEINQGPDYQKIYSEIIERYHPEMKDACIYYLKRAVWSSMDVITVNDILFSKKNSKQVHLFNQKHRAYDEATINKILAYQKKHKLNDTQVALHFKLSRNSIAKWKKNLTAC